MMKIGGKLWRVALGFWLFERGRFLGLDLMLGCP
jgi:hypothetical protein